jgi:hypothetical protein
VLTGLWVQHKDSSNKAEIRNFEIECSRLGN